MPEPINPDEIPSVGFDPDAIERAREQARQGQPVDPPFVPNPIEPNRTRSRQRNPEAEAEGRARRGREAADLVMEAINGIGNGANTIRDDLFGALRDQMPPEMLGLPPTGGGGFGGGGSGPDPIQRLQDILKDHRDDELDAIGQQFGNMIGQVKEQRRRSRGEITASADETVSALQTENERLRERLAAIDSGVSSRRSAVDARTDIDAGTRGSIAALRELDDNLRDRLNQVSEINAGTQVGTSRAIQQAGNTTLINSSSQMISELRRERAEQKRLAKSNYRDGVFQLRAGQVTGGSGGGGGGRSGGGSTGGFSEQELLYAQLAGQALDIDPNVLLGLDSLGLADNYLAIQQDEKARELASDHDLALGEALLGGVEGGLFDPAAFSPDDLLRIQRYVEEVEQPRREQGARDLGNRARDFADRFFGF